VAGKRVSRAPARGHVPSKNPESKSRIAAKRDATRSKAQKRGGR
jgi:hypothetical protein